MYDFFFNYISFKSKCRLFDIVEKDNQSVFNTAKKNDNKANDMVRSTKSNNFYVFMSKYDKFPVEKPLFTLSPLFLKENIEQQLSPLLSYSCFV